MPRPLPLAALALLAMSCNDKTEPSEDSGAAAIVDPTWHADISPMMQTYCTRCHNDGGLGTGDFTSYDTVNAMSELMLAAIDAGEMPPAASDPECRDYLGSEHMWLPDEQRDLLAAWIDDGHPEGDAADAVEVPEITEELVGADLNVPLPEPYTPAFADAANPGNEYRCFVVDHGQTEDFYITGFQSAVDNRDVMHHAVLYTTTTDDIDEKYLDPSGFDCINGAEFAIVGEMIHGWAPGSLPLELPEGAGLKVRADQKFVIQNHYFDPGTLDGPAVDNSGYDFNIASSVENEVFLWTLGVYNFAIPADDPAYSKKGRTSIPSGYDVKLYSAFPHMHVLGSGFRMWYEDENDAEHCLLESGGYDFENQLQYIYPEPLTIPGGSTVRYECTWNNSTSNADLIHDPPVDTYYGERTDEEMCFFFAVVGL